ncbi:MAG: transcriptional regulator [Bacteroidota bacterium]
MGDKLVGIITGDVVNSREGDPDRWQHQLKSVLNKHGKRPSEWEIFRGDSFQVEVVPAISLVTAIEIKAAIKEDEYLVDVRMALGIGRQEHKSDRITDSNGEAYTHSGHCFEELKKRRLAIKTPWSDFDEEWNLYLRLASLTMDDWKPKTAIIFREALLHPQETQIELAKRLGKTQSTISESLSRAGYNEIESMLAKFQRDILERITQ